LKAARDKLDKYRRKKLSTSRDENLQQLSTVGDELNIWE
jgi:hypothetical protein